MRIQSGVLLASLALAFSISAQTEGQKDKTTGEVDKLWKIEASGIGG